MRILFWSILCSILFVSCLKEPKLKIACIGDSITSGYLLEDIEKDSYPSVLQRLMGDSCEVKNFGFAQRTLLQKGDYPYMKEQMYKDALSYNPDIVIIMLGTNDTSPENMKYKEEFVEDMTQMVKSFQQSPASPRVYLCLPTQPYKVFAKRDSILTGIMFPYIKEVSKNCNAGLIDLHSVTSDSTLYIDGIHPNKKGAEVIAQTVYDKIKENLD